MSALIKEIRKVKLIKANVTYIGVTENHPGTIKEPRKGTGGNRASMPVVKTSVQATIDEIRDKFQISNEEALIIRQVCEAKKADETILLTIQRNKNRMRYLQDVYKQEILLSIEQSYTELGHDEELYKDEYVEDGAIFDMMAYGVLNYGLGQVLSG